MRIALLGTVLWLCWASVAHAQLKPYVVLILDTSGSMDDPTGSGPPSCASTADTRMDHAKCAIQNVANSYGDMIWGLGRFRATSSDTNCADGCSISGIDCGACDVNDPMDPDCTANLWSDARFEMLVGMQDGNNGDIVRWSDFSCGTCTADLGSNPELRSAGWTPIAGSLRGVKRYWQGLQASDGTTIWANGLPGFDPIRNDPLKNVFLPSGEQCRPYVVISLTDGEETCTAFTNTTAAAASLLTTVVDGQTYRIETKAIGFGLAPGSSSIEGIAHAGGAPDVGGVNEGLYARNEEELQLAMTSIIAEAVRSEICNELDDDCDTAIDEDFPSKGQVCFDSGIGACRGSGVYVCRADGTGTECQITDPGDASSTEVCDGIDNDCDGQTDEGACGGCGSVELCNNMDDDCDGLIDEGLVRDCGTDIGVCSPGTQVCAAGTWSTCSGTGPNTEVCDGLDNNCDTVIDGITESCSNLPGGNPGIGICHPGTHACVANGTGTWGPCVGEQVPRPESCNGLDDDCDGQIDEGTGGADCSNNCGVGTTICVNGVLECDSTTAVGDSTCNGIDDDCDGMIDEDATGGGACTDGGQICDGQLECIAGGYVCVGTAVGTEICDCLDNDCDSLTDENNGGCPGDSTCTSCQCALPCEGGEFPCPVGRYCSEDNFCLLDPCTNVMCTPNMMGEATTCVEGTCVVACTLANCSAGFVCLPETGQCAPDNCTTFPDRCADGEACVAGVCVVDACAGVECPVGQYCTGGTCVASCADVVCPDGQVCELGACRPTACDTCLSTQVCNEQTGQCIDNPCNDIACGAGQWCNPQTAACEADPCLTVTCPGADQICRGGTCYEPPAAAPPDVVTTGGGRSCNTGAPGWLALVGLWLLRRRGAKAAGGLS